MGTPGNIPNPAVKHISADGTWLATAWESRSLPRGFSFTKMDRFLAVFSFKLPDLGVVELFYFLLITGDNYAI